MIPLGIRGAGTNLVRFISRVSGCVSGRVSGGVSGCVSGRVSGGVSGYVSGCESDKSSSVPCRLVKKMYL